MILQEKFCLIVCWIALIAMLMACVILVSTGGLR